MANDIEMKVKLGTVGLKEAVDLSSQFNNNMQAGAAAATNTKVPGGTASSRALAAKVSGTTKSSPPSPDELNSYNMARGTGSGTTGSATSDFAAQARGLGGLVHLYATFAANLFAAEAAFRSLSNAMDTANLAKGLDQLGAATGKSLGGLAKQMVEVTNGAISMRQAMSSTAMASSGGMSNDMIIRMTEVAKKASLALGRDLSDSMDRLTKGIVKVQPELLDELGIMTRVIPAQQAYAQSIGKTVSSLTEFEKRQAFTNAVIAEGEKKFSEIQLDTNPYSKLLASMTNLAQAGLSLINTVLGPLTKLLAESPTALATVMAGIGAILLNKALPALGAWREGLRRSADEAAATAKRINEAFVDFDVESRMSKAVAKAAPFKEAANAAIADAQTALGSVLGAKTKIMTSIMSGSNLDIPGTTALIDKQIKSGNTVLANLIEQRKVANQNDTQHLAALDAQIDKYNTRIIKLKEGNIQLEIAAKALAAETAEMDKFDKTSEKFSIGIWARQQNAKVAQSVSTSKNILANVGDNTQTMGMSASFKKLSEDIKNSANSMGLLAKGATYAAGTVTILGAAFGTLMRAVAPWLIAIDLIITAFSAFRSYVATAKESQEAFDKSLETNAAALKVSADAVDYLANKTKTLFTTQGVEAMTNAISGLSEALSASMKSFDEFELKKGWLESLTQTQGNIDNFKDSVAKDVPALLNNLMFSFKKADSEAKLLRLLPTLTPEDLASSEKIKAALSELSNSDLKLKLKEIVSVVQEISIEEQKSTFAIKSFSESIVNIGKEVDNTINKLTFKEGIGKLGVDLQDASIKMTQALKDPIKGLLSLRELVSDPKSLSLLPPNAVADLIKAKPLLDSLVSQEDILQKKILKNQQIIDIKGAAKAPEAVADNAQLNKQLDTLKLKIQATTKEMANVTLQMYEEGAKLITDGLKNAVAAAALISKKSDVSLASAAGLDTADQEYKLRMEELGIQRRNIDAAYRLQAAVIRNAEALEEQNARQTQESVGKQIQSKTDLMGGILSPEKLKLLQNTFDSADKTLKEISLTRARRDKSYTGFAMKEDPEVWKGSSARLQQDEANAAARTAALAATAAAEHVALNDKNLKTIDELTRRQQEGLNLERVSLDNKTKQTANLQALVGGYSEVLEKQKLQEALDKNELDYRQKIYDLENKRKKLELVPSTARGDTKNYLRKLEGVTEQESAASQAKTLADTGATDTYNAGKSAQMQKVAVENLAKSNAYLDISVKQEMAYLALKEQELSNALALNQVDGITYANNKASLDIQKQELTYAKEKLNTNAAVMEAQIAYNELSLKAAKSDKPEAFNEQLAAAKSKLDLAKENNKAADASNMSALASIELTRSHSVELEKQKNHLAEIASIGATLTGVFGEVGTALGAAISAIDTFGKNSLENSKQIIEAEKQKRIATEQTALAAASGMDEKDILSFKKKEQEADENIAKLKSKSTKQELTDTANIIGSVKNMFDIKSKSYKALANIERAYHIAKLALDMKEFAVKIGLIETTTAAQTGAELANTAKAEAGFMARSATYVKEIYGKTIGQLGPIIGPVVAAGLISSFLGAVSSSSSEQSYSDFTGTQNTGTGTVFGDSSKPDESLKNALELLSSTAKPELEYSSKMVALLANIDNSLSGATNSLIAGGFDPSGSSFRGLSTSVANIGSSIPIIGGILGGILGGGSSRTETFAGTGLKFGDQTVRQATTNGIDVQKYIDKQIHETSSGFLGFGGSDRTYYERSLSSVQSDAKQAMVRVIAHMKDMTIQASKFMGVTDDISSAIDNLNLSLGDVELTGTADEIKAKLTAIMSNVGSRMAQLAVNGLEPFQKVGEGYLDTMVRVSSGIEQASYYTDKLGISAVNYTQLIKKQGDVAAELVRQAITDKESKTVTTTTTQTTRAPLFSILFGGPAETTTYLTTTKKINNNIGKIIENFQGTAEEITNLYTNLVDVRNVFEVLGISADAVSASLLKGAGGIDSLVSSLDAFQSGFLTTAEQTAIKQAKMDKEFKKLGLTTPKTAKDFKALVLSLQDGGDATSELLGRVLSLSSGMKDLTGGITEALSGTALLNAQLDQTIKIYELLGNSAAVLALQRQKELDALDAQLRPTQRYIYALQDEATARGKVTTAINSTISSLKSSIKTLKDYKSSLNMGALSTLDPTQKYQEAQKSLKELQATISMTATTEADKAAQADAISKLPAASDAFLNASKVLFGGSAQYVQDVQSINDFLDMNTVKLNSQLDIATQQLTTLNEISAALGFIQTSTTDTAMLLSQYLAAADAVRTASTSATMTPVPAHAAGGVAYGVSLVGEKGPELVDFATPSRVYSNNATRGLLDNSEMVKELQALREEVAKLREDQREQTGQIIITNYEANLKAADRVVNATEDAASTANWSNRSAPKLL